MKIVVYSQDYCPKCKVLKKKLDNAKILYEECKDENEIERLGIELIPALNIDGDVLHYADAVNWVNGMVGD